MSHASTSTATASHEEAPRPGRSTLTADAAPASTAHHWEDLDRPSSGPGDVVGVLFAAWDVKALLATTLASPEAFAASAPKLIADMEAFAGRFWAYSSYFHGGDNVDATSKELRAVAAALKQVHGYLEIGTADYIAEKARLVPVAAQKALGEIKWLHTTTTALTQTAEALTDIMTTLTGFGPQHVAKPRG